MTGLAVAPVCDRRPFIRKDFGAPRKPGAGAERRYNEEACGTCFRNIPLAPRTAFARDFRCLPGKNMTSGTPRNWARPEGVEPVMRCDGQQA
jgi:hypothetical protein